MIESRYASVPDRLRFWLNLEHRGWGVVIVPPTEQATIAAVLHDAFPERPVIVFDANTTSEWFVPIALDESGAAAASGRRPGAFVRLAPGLSDDERKRLIVMLNQQRDRTSSFGVWVLVVSMSEFLLVQRHAGDLWSVIREREIIPLEPRPMSEAEIVAARAELHAYYQRRFGRLDLRGFIRSEQEDVSFAVEEIFQPLRARPERAFTRDSRDAIGDLARGMRRAPLVEHLAALRGGPALIVGAPGAGKSFFLRWCALEGSRAPRFLDRDRPIPVYVPLAVTRMFTELPSLEDYMVTSLLEAGQAVGHVLAEEARMGRVMFLLDGLDEAGTTRQRLVDHVAALVAKYPASRVIVSSRPTGLADISFAAERYEIEGLDDEAIRALLGAWCELYEVHRAGAGGAARGRSDGEALAAQVVASPTLVELARTPLLATIIAIVHRAGVRLPDHRVELYEHIVRILVERWNDLRSRDAEMSPPIIRVPDAIRLLGPVAYEMVRAGNDGAIQEDSLRDLIAQQLKRGTIRSVASADEALDVFRNSLGLLVEQAPGVYAFLHKTIGEFLAAHELLRTDGFERMLAEEAAFSPKWREVVLLALGLVGTVHANDDRLERAIERLIAQVRANPVLDADHVATLMFSILADDPALSPALATRLVEYAVAAWSRSGAAAYVSVLRVAAGPWSGVLAAALRAHFKSTPFRPISSSRDAIYAIHSVALREHAGFSPLLLVIQILTACLFGRSETAWRPALTTVERDRLDAALRAHDVEELIDEDGAYRLVGHPPLLPSVLAAWRDLAAADDRGPAPPASVEEAIAIYGPPQSVQGGGEGGGGGEAGGGILGEGAGDGG